MTDEPRESRKDAPAPSEDASESLTLPAPLPPMGDARPGDAPPARRAQDIDEEESERARRASEEELERARRPGDDAPAPRWRDRRARAVGWRSRDILRATAIVVAIYTAMMLVWRTNQLWLVSFLGILFGLATSSGVDWLHGRGMRWIPRGVLAALIVFGTVGTIVGFFVWSGPTLATQFGELRTRLPEALDEVEDWARQQGGFAAGLIIGASDDKGSRSDTIVVAPTTPEPVAPVLPPRVPDGSPEVIADSVGSAILAARDSFAAQDTLGLVTPLVDSLLASISESARGAAIAAARDAARERELEEVRAAAAAAATAAAQRSASSTNVAVVVPGSDSVASGEGEASLRERAIGSLRGATRYLFPFLTSTAAVLAGLVLVIFLAIYIAADPRTYRRGIMHLFPRKVRGRASEVLGAIALVLRKWLVTQLIAMLVIGTVTTVVLYMLDVEAALPLGIIAGLLEFIPNIGPILAAIPAIAMGFVDSPEKALWVAIAYWAIQFLENQLLIPLLMQEGVDLPPALTLLAQALLAIVFGFLGLFVAVPLVAAGVVAVRMLYVEDVVGEGLDPFDREDSPSLVRRVAARGILARRRGG